MSRVPKQHKSILWCKYTVVKEDQGIDMHKTQRADESSDDKAYLESYTYSASRDDINDITLTLAFLVSLRNLTHTSFFFFFSTSFCAAYFSQNLSPK
jgi:hypothetical protein